MVVAPILRSTTMCLHYCHLIGTDVEISEESLPYGEIGSEDVDELLDYLCDHDEECCGCPSRRLKGCHLADLEPSPS